MKVLDSNLLLEDSGIIVHGCNAQGVFNAGIAKQIREKYPQVYLDYKNKHNQFGLQLGDIIITKINSNLFFVSAITQKYYGRNKNKIYVSYNAILHCFQKINELALKENLEVKFPKIGCGLANGNWHIVKDIINSCLDKSIPRAVFVIDNVNTL
jgi:O-acetyl-ADP-ribose deacetylase (regulator of RNase III)